MTGLNCPTCQQPCLSAWTKLGMGPARTVRCKSCGCGIGVGWLRSTLVLLCASVLPFVAATFASVEIMRQIQNPPLGAFALLFVFLVALGSLPFLWAYVRFVPLVARAA